MSSMVFYSVLALCGFILSLIGTRIMIIALRERAQPLDIGLLRGRKNPTAPSGGGIVVVFSTIICLLVADMNYVLALCVLLLAAISMMNNILPVPHFVRMLVQIIAVAIPLSLSSYNILDGIAPIWMGQLLLGLLWLWLIQKFSEMDSIDGLCASHAIVVAGGLCLIAVFDGIFPNQIFVYGLLVSAATMGFVWWNWHPAKIRLGEVGSVSLGFITGYLILLALDAGYGEACLILVSFIIVEAITTFIRRIYYRHSPEKDLAPYHDRAVKVDRTPHNIVRIITSLNFLLIFLAISCAADPNIFWFNLSMAYLAVMFILSFLVRHTHE